MYTQEDRTQIRQRIVKYTAITLILAGILVAAFVMCLIKRSQPLAMLSGCALFSVICFMWCMFLYPNIHYATFLKDMQNGLTRMVKGSIVEVSDKEDLQDGVRVYPVRVMLDEEKDERIVYLNVSKAENFPANGASVRLNCFGRHIKEVAVG